MSNRHREALLGVSAEVTLGKDASLLRYRDEKGRVLVTRQIKGLQYGDALQIPFYGDVTVTVAEECQKCEKEINNG